MPSITYFHYSITMQNGQNRFELRSNYELKKSKMSFLSEKISDIQKPSHNFALDLITF